MGRVAERPLFHSSFLGFFHHHTVHSSVLTLHWENRLSGLVDSQEHVEQVIFDTCPSVLEYETQSFHQHRTFNSHRSVAKRRMLRTVRSMAFSFPGHCFSSLLSKQSTPSKRFLSSTAQNHTRTSIAISGFCFRARIDAKSNVPRFNEAGFHTACCTDQLKPV